MTLDFFKKIFKKLNIHSELFPSVRNLEYYRNAIDIIMDYGFI